MNRQTGPHRSRRRLKTDPCGSASSGTPLRRSSARPSSQLPGLTRRTISCRASRTWTRSVSLSACRSVVMAKVDFGRQLRQNAKQGPRRHHDIEVEPLSPRGFAGRASAPRPRARPTIGSGCAPSGSGSRTAGRAGRTAAPRPGRRPHSHPGRSRISAMSHDRRSWSPVRPRPRGCRQQRSHSNEWCRRQVVGRRRLEALTI